MSNSGACLNNNRQSSMNTFLHLTKYWILPDIYFIKQINVNLACECWIIALIVSGIEKLWKGKVERSFYIFSWLLKTSQGKTENNQEMFSRRQIFPRFLSFFSLKLFMFSLALLSCFRICNNIKTRCWASLDSVAQSGGPFNGFLSQLLISANRKDCVR